jgi:MOSC domain-containing protein YiiM
MKLLSLNTGRPRDVAWNGQAVRSSIWKSPREGRLRVASLNIDGDQQSDLSVHGGREKAVYVYPNRIQVGTAEFLVTQPRQPCFKLGIRFGRDDMIRRYLASGRSGFYVAVAREGELASGDSIAFTHRAADSLSISAIASLRTADGWNQDLLSRAAALPALSAGWREHFRKRLGE